jgi:DNA helicase-2/ATP-dependent DNA helicase PcrA
VFLVGCEEGRLPGWQALESPDRRAPEEERRLCYVAFTRAKRRLTVTWAAERYGRDSDGPSRFIAEAGLGTGA